jgi:dimethylargininase
VPRAFTRAVSPRLAECALTHLERAPINASVAALQHAAYERALGEAGFDVVRLPELPDDPDAVFVEDTALLLNGHAVITRPGAPPRADEAESTARGLEPYFTIHRLASGTLDGGDVLRIGDRLYVGQSSRSDALGTAALADLVAPLGFSVVPVELGRCLHLKTAVTFAGPDGEGRPTLLVNRDWVDPALFA